MDKKNVVLLHSVVYLKNAALLMLSVILCAALRMVPVLNPKIAIPLTVLAT